jgi:hypothetical protein
MSAGMPVDIFLGAAAAVIVFAVVEGGAAVIDVHVLAGGAAAAIALSVSSRWWHCG